MSAVINCTCLRRITRLCGGNDIADETSSSSKPFAPVDLLGPNDVTTSPLTASLLMWNGMPQGSSVERRSVPAFISYASIKAWALRASSRDSLMFGVPIISTKRENVISSGNLSSFIERQSDCVGHVLTAHATDDRAARHPDRPNLSTHARTAGRPPLRSITLGR